MSFEHRRSLFILREYGHIGCRDKIILKFGDLAVFYCDPMHFFQASIRQASAYHVYFCEDDVFALPELHIGKRKVGVMLCPGAEAKRTLLEGGRSVL